MKNFYKTLFLTLLLTLVNLKVDAFRAWKPSTTILFFSKVVRTELIVNMSEQRVKISPLVIERLNKIQESSAGYLYGVRHDSVLSILGFSLISKRSPGQENNENNPDSTYNHDLLPNLPANINILGVFVVGSSDDLNYWEKKYLQTESKELSKESVILHLDYNSKTVSLKLKKENSYSKAEYEVVKDSYLKQFYHFHIIAKFIISSNYDIKSFEDALSSLKKKIKQGVAFQLEGRDVYILENYANGPGITDKSDVGDLINTCTEKSRFENDNLLNFNMFLKSCCDSTAPDIAPIIKYEKKSFQCAKFTLPVDALSIIDVKSKVNELYKILIESIYRNLALVEDCLLKQFKESDLSRISLPQIYHFFPKQCGHFVTIAYPKKQMEDQLVSEREVFHKVLSLPMDIPIFRRGNTHSFVVSNNSDKILINPHEGLNPSGVVDGEVSLVQGSYAYHHYMQNGFDDSGWGCAYRSLQTIVSWFRLQGFTGKPVPSHREIQKCLVDIGDKPSSFVGSTNWIGSTEVSFVLDTLLSISCRIVSVSSGEELSMKGGELSHHFKTQGTPIMIGGGVLAHTILGVDYNKKTGSLKFLILDPHYTGEDDLSIIQAKGWCGWKGMDFWKKNAFYNMCLPLRPKSI